MRLFVHPSRQREEELEAAFSLMCGVSANEVHDTACACQAYGVNGTQHRAGTLRFVDEVNLQLVATSWSVLDRFWFGVA